jgi:hypothetical protein
MVTDALAADAVIVDSTSHGHQEDQHQAERGTRVNDEARTSTPEQQAQPGRCPTREELIAQAVANIGQLTPEQRDRLALLLPPPAPAGGRRSP